MSRSQNSFIKKQKEKIKAQKKKEKAERKKERQSNKKEGNLDNMLAYLDEDGNIVSGKPDDVNSDNEKENTNK